MRKFLKRALFFCLLICSILSEQQSYATGIAKILQKKSRGHATIHQLQDLIESDLDYQTISSFSGNLSLEAVQDILYFMQAKKLLEIPREIDGNKVDDLVTFEIKELSEVGVFTGQIFMVSIKFGGGGKKPLWILKGVKKGLTELDNLQIVTDEVIAPLLNRSNIREEIIRDNLPKVTDVVVNFSLRSQADKNPLYYFSLLEIAKGKSFSKIIKDYSLSKENLAAKNQMVEVFKEIGNQMATLHYALQNPPPKNRLAFGKTKIHGDLHSGNIYIDLNQEGKAQVYLIDNETFAMGDDYGPKDLADLYFLTTEKTLAHHYTKQLFTYKDLNISSDDWDLFWRTSFDHYIKTYSLLTGIDEESVRKEFKKLLTKRISFYKTLTPHHLGRLIDTRYLKMLQTPNLNLTKDKNTLSHLLTNHY